MFFWNNNELFRKIEITNRLKNSGLYAFQNDSSLLIAEWKNSKKDLVEIFEKTNFKNHIKIKSDVNLAFHTNKRYSNSYNSEKNIIGFNLASYLYLLTEGSLLFFKPKFLIAHYLIHELDHYHYCKENDGIGLLGDEQDDWDQIHEQNLEINANNTQIKFLQNLMEIFPNEFSLISGSDMHKKRTQNTTNFLNQLYNECENRKRQINKKSLEYQSKAMIDGSKSNVQLYRTLKIPIDHTENDDYYRIFVNF